MIYNQIGIGDCGHTLTVWPQFTGPGGRNPRVICDQCTREAYGINQTEQFILVGINMKLKTKPARRTSSQRTRSPKKPPRKSPWQLIIEGL